MEFNTNYDRTKVPHSNPEINDGPVLVELDGYLSMEQQIAAMMEEGRELAYARAHQFDWAPDVPVDEAIASDPTRTRGFDMADASMLARTIRPTKREVANDISKTGSEGGEVAVADNKDAGSGGNDSKQKRV